MGLAGWVYYTAAGLLLMALATLGLMAWRAAALRRRLDIPRLIRGETDWIE